MFIILSNYSSGGSTATGNEDVSDQTVIYTACGRKGVPGVELVAYADANMVKETSPNLSRATAQIF